jgi:hypothetical protein
MSTLPVSRVVLYKHGVGYFEREGKVENDATLSLTFKQSEVSDVLKSLTVLDLDGGHIASVSYDSTKPLEQLLSEVSLTIPDQGSLVSLLPQVKGARVALHSGVSDPIEGSILGIDTTERQTGDGIVKIVLLSVLTDRGDIRSVDLHSLASLQMLDTTLRRDLDFYLKTQLSAKKKDARTFTFFAQGLGERKIRLSYTLQAPVWKATYRILLGEEGKPPMIQGWAVVDNTQDEDWENVQLSLIAGLPVAFTHDLYTPRYIRRPEVRVQETTGVLPPTMEVGMADYALMEADQEMAMPMSAAAPMDQRSRGGMVAGARFAKKSAVSSTPTQVRERKVGDLFEYEIEHPVTIKRNQSALVPIVLRDFQGRPVLLYNKQNRADNPMRCVEFKNTTGLTLEGGPVTVLEASTYVGEAMLETMKPDEERLVPYSVELGVSVLDNVDSFNERVHRVTVHQGVLQAHYVQVSQTKYHFNNKSSEPQTVYLEHPRSGEWQLVSTPAPHETTENYWRFRLSLEPNKVTAFVVKQKLPLSQVYHLGSLVEPTFAWILEQKYLNPKTEQALRDVIAAKREAADLDAAVQSLGQERATIHNEQKRIRENLQSLGDRPGEKELRERFIRTLNAQEDRLEQIEKDVQSKQQASNAARDKINAMLAKMEYDAEI